MPAAGHPLQLLCHGPRDIHGMRRDPSPEISGLQNVYMFLSTSLDSLDSLLIYTIVYFILNPTTLSVEPVLTQIAGGNSLMGKFGSRLGFLSLLLHCLPARGVC